MTSKDEIPKEDDLLFRALKLAELPGYADQINYAPSTNSFTISKFIESEGGFIKEDCSFEEMEKYLNETELELKRKNKEYGIMGMIRRMTEKVQIGINELNSIEQNLNEDIVEGKEATSLEVTDKEIEEDSEYER